MLSDDEIAEIRLYEARINASLKELLETGRISGEAPEFAALESYVQASTSLEAEAIP